MKMKRILAFILAAAMIMGLCACNNAPKPASEPINIVFVLGIADGEAVVPNDSIRELTALPSQPGSSVAFVSAESTPASIGKPISIADLSDRGYTDTMQERARQGIRADLSERISTYSPSVGELDLAAATAYAVRQLNATAVPGRKNLLVFCASGRSTRGLINFSETPISRVDVDATVPGVAEQMHTDLKAVDEIIWYSCADCGGERQQTLSSAERAKLREFYAKLFQTLGAPDVEFRDDLPDAGYYSFPSKPVTRMETEETVSGLQELKAVTPDALEQTALLEPLVFPESMVRYCPDSDEFLDPAAAEAAIQPVADYLLQHRDLQVLLYGTCAGDTDSDSALSLARARAERVREALISAAVEESRITVLPVSIYDDRYYQFGLGTGSAASVNRKVVLMDLHSPEAERLLACATP